MAAAELGSSGSSPSFLPSFFSDFLRSNCVPLGGGGRSQQNVRSFPWACRLADLSFFGRMFYVFRLVISTIGEGGVRCTEVEKVRESKLAASQSRGKKGKGFPR